MPLPNTATKIRKDFLLAAIIFTVVTSVYLFTLAPTIYLEDSGELITAAATLGIPHPSGYPLYVLLGKLFTFIPLGTIAWRVNLLSAVFGALTCSLLYLIIQRLIQNRFLAVASALLLPFSSTFWSQSVVAEVYTLNSFFVALLLLLLIIWQKNQQEKFLLWFAFLYGLSLTNHTMMVLLAPAFGLFVFLADKNFFKKPKLIFGMLILFVLGLSVYLYLPLRSLQNPALDWGNPENLKNFWAHVSRKSYGDFLPFLPESSKLDFFGAFIIYVFNNLSWPLVVAAVLGLILTFIKKIKIGILTLGVFLLNSFGIIILRSLKWGIEPEYLYRVYYLPSLMMVIVWLAYFLVFFNQRFFAFLKTRNWQQFGFFFKLLFNGALISLPLFFLISNYQTNDKSNFWLNYDYTKKLLETMPPRSIYLFFTGETLSGDTELFSLMYLQLVEKFRNDLVIIDDCNFFSRQVNSVASSIYQEEIPVKRKERFLQLAWAKAKTDNVRLYANFTVNQNTARQLKLFSRSNGIINTVYPSLSSAKAAQEKFTPVVIKNLADPKIEADYSATAVLSRYYYNLANYYLENFQEDETLFHLIKAIELDPRPASSDYRDFIIHRKEWQEF